MYINKKTLCFISLISLSLLSGCATSYAPDNWLPETEDIPTNVYGGWITVITEPDSLNHDEQWMQYSGELISVGEENIYVLFDSLYVISKMKIQRSILELDEKSSTAYGLWTLGGTISTVSNGAFLIFTAPMWLLFGIPSAVGESTRDRYDIEYPDENYWTEIQKYARFPQGLPPEVNVNELKPKNIPMK